MEEEKDMTLNNGEVFENVEDVVFVETDITGSISPEEDETTEVSDNEPEENILVSEGDLENYSNTENTKNIDGEAADDTPPAEEVSVESDDFSLFLSVLDENSDDYEWVVNQLSHTVQVNDMVEEYDEAMRLRAEAEAAAEKARIEAEEKEKARIEEEKRLEEARLKAEEEARLKAEEEARLKAEEEARLKAEEEARLKAEEEARLKAEEEARLKAEEEERKRIEELIKAKAAEEAQKAREVAEAEAAAEESENSLVEDDTDEFIVEDFDVDEEIEDLEPEDVSDEEIQTDEKNVADDFKVKDEPEVFEETEDPVDSEDVIVGRRHKKMDDRLAKLNESVEDHMQKKDRKGRYSDSKARFDSIFGSNAGKKDLKVFGIPKNVFGIIITVIFAIDMFFINSASYKVVYFLMEKLLVSNGVEALRLSDKGFSDIFVGVSYLASFFIGGVAILITAKLAEKLIQGVAFANGRAVTMSVVGVFALIFLVGTVFTIILNRNLLSLEVYRWGGPLLTYLGGLLFLAISKVSLSIDY